MKLVRCLLLTVCVFILPATESLCFLLDGRVGKYASLQCILSAHYVEDFREAGCCKANQFRGGPCEFCGGKDPYHYCPEGLIILQVGDIGGGAVVLKNKKICGTCAKSLFTEMFPRECCVVAMMRGHGEMTGSVHCSKILRFMDGARREYESYLGSSPDLLRLAFAASISLRPGPDNWESESVNAAWEKLKADDERREAARKKAEEERIALEAARARMVGVNRVPGAFSSNPCLCGTDSIVFSVPVPSCPDRVPPTAVTTTVSLSGSAFHVRCLNTETVLAGPVADATGRYYTITPGFVCGFEGERMLWEQRLRPRSYETYSLTVDNQRNSVYATSGGLVSALGKDSGAILWRYTQRIDDLVTSSTIIPGGLIYGVGNRSGYFLAINPETGEPVWDLQLPISSEPIFTPPVVNNNGLIYVGNSRGNLYAISVADHRIVWEINVGKAIQHPMVVGNGKVYVAAENKFLSLDAAVGGAPQWIHEFDVPILAPVFNSAVNALYVTKGTQLLAFSPTGEPLGVFNVPSSEHFPFPPAVNGRMLCIGSVPIGQRPTSEQYTNIHVIRVGANGNLNIL